MAYKMRHVALKLCNTLKERARVVPRVSMRLLIFASRGKTPREQIERWDEYVLSATCEIVKAKRAEKKSQTRHERNATKHTRKRAPDDEAG